MHPLNIEQAFVLTGHTASIFALEQASEAHCFYAGDGSGKVILWDLKNKDTAHLVANVPSNIFALKLLRDRNLLVIGSLQGALYFIDIQASKRLELSLQFPKTIYALAQLGNLLLIGTGDGILSIFDLETQKISQQIPLSEKSIRTIVLLEDQKNVAIGCSDHHIYILDANSLAQKAALVGHENSVFCLQYLPKFQQLLSGSRDAHLAIWGTSSDSVVLEHKIPAHFFTINSIALSPNQSFFATESRDKSIKIWSAEQSKLLKVIDNSKEKFTFHKNSVNALLWLSHEDYLVSASDDRSLMIWRVNYELEIMN